MFAAEGQVWRIRPRRPCRRRYANNQISSSETTMRKYLFMLGILATPWWVFTVLLFGELQPGYNHFYHAASELGAFGASNPLAMNIFCFFLTGVFVALAGLGFVNYLQSRQESRTAGWWVFILGVMLAGAAVPADIELYFHSPWTVVHAFFVLLGVIPFFIAAWKTHSVLRRLGEQSKFLCYFPWAIVPAFALHGLLSQGGLVQRLTILIVLVWVSVLSWRLLKRIRPHNQALNSQATAAGTPHSGAG